MKKPDKIIIFFRDIPYGQDKGKTYADVCFSDQRHRGTEYKVIQIQKSKAGELWTIELWRSDAGLK